MSNTLNSNPINNPISNKTTPDFDHAQVSQNETNELSKTTSSCDSVSHEEIVSSEVKGVSYPNTIASKTKESKEFCNAKKTSLSYKPHPSKPTTCPELPHLRILFLAIISGLIVMLTMTLCSCHQHQEPIDTQMKIGSILCTDGQTVDYRQYVQSDLQAIGVVFYVNHDPTVAGKGYAVYLRDLYPSEFADTLGMEQGTSKDVYDLRGNENTYALQSNERCGSPLAEAVFDMWQYGQSAYIPSVGQYKLLFMAKDVVNNYLVQLGGDPIESEADKCWYWSSTEVEGQSKDKAWLFSLCNGTYQETPKDQAHKSRPIITIY